MKKAAILFLLPLLIIIVLLRLTIFQPSGIPVLNYHQINDTSRTPLAVTTQDFDKQMDYLHKSGYSAISPEQLADYLEFGKALPPNPVLITFDDGYIDNYVNAYPILQKYNFTATFFVITDYVGRNGQYMSWKQIRDMQSHGLSFQSHTVSHLLLADISDEEMQNQLINSKKALEWHLQTSVNFLAYPGGSYNQHVISLTRQAGYRAAFTVNLGRTTAGDLFALNRIPIFGGRHSYYHFILRLKYTEAAIALRNLKVTWLNLKHIIQK